jgi:hypothetical protein
MAADHILSTSSGKVAGNASSSTVSFTYPQRTNKTGMKRPDNGVAIINPFQWKLSIEKVPIDCQQHIKVFCLYGTACHQNPLPKLHAEEIY